MRSRAQELYPVYSFLYFQSRLDVAQSGSKTLSTRASMIFSRRRSFRPHVAVLFLAVAGLVPLKTVFACAMTDWVVEQCCCDHERCEGSAASSHGSGTSEGLVPDERCCAVTSGVSSDKHLAIAKSAIKQPSKKLWDSSPDLATAPPVLLTAPTWWSTRHSPLLSGSHVLNGSRTYLLSARLRL